MEKVIDLLEIQASNLEANAKINHDAATVARTVEDQDRLDTQARLEEATATECRQAIVRLESSFRAYMTPRRDVTMPGLTFDPSDVSCVNETNIFFKNGKHVHITFDQSNAIHTLFIGIAEGR